MRQDFSAAAAAVAAIVLFAADPTGAQDRGAPRVPAAPVRPTRPDGRPPFDPRDRRSGGDSEDCSARSATGGAGGLPWEETWGRLREGLFEQAVQGPADSRPAREDVPGEAGAGAREARAAAETVLVRLTEDAQEAVRIAALGSLGRVAGDVGVSVLLSTARGERPLERVASLLALGSSGQASVLPALLFVARDRAEPAEPRVAASLALGLAGRAEAAGCLLETVRDREAPLDLRVAAVAGLGLLNPGASVFDEFLVPGLDPRLRGAAAFATAGCAEPASARSLAVLLADPETSVRRFAASALARLAGALRARRGSAADLESARAAAVDPLRRSLEALSGKDSSAAWRAEVAAALGCVGGPRAVASLADEFDSGDPERRAAGALGLGLSGHVAAAPELRRCLIDRNGPGTARAAAALALGLLRDRGAIDPLLGRLRHDEDRGVRHYAAVALGLLGDRRAVTELSKAALTWVRDPLVSEGACAALGLIDHPSAREALLAMAFAPDVDRALPALAALGRRPDPAILPRVAGVAEEASRAPRLRVAAIRVLGRFGGPGGFPEAGSGGESPIPSLEAMIRAF